MALAGKARLVLRFTRQNGWSELLRRAGMASARPLCLCRALTITTLAAPEVEPPAPGFTFREISLADLDTMAALMYLTRAALRERLTAGQRCFAVVDGGAVVAFFWATFGVRRLDEVGLEARLRDDEAWFFNAVTLPAARGRGCYPQLIRHMCGVLRGEGVRRFYIDAEPHNRASLRGIAKAGFRPVATLRFTERLSLPSWSVCVEDSDAWQRLRLSRRAV